LQKLDQACHKVAMMNRRSILKSTLAGAVGFALMPIDASVAAQASPAQTSLIRLNDKLAVITGVGSNVIALSTGDGLLVVDSGALEHRDALMTQLRNLSNSRVHTLFNTHWHLDSAGSNEAFGSAGAKIIAHERTKQWIATDHFNQTTLSFDKAQAKTAVPSETFYTNGKLNAGGEVIEYGYLLQAHTSGDIYVYFRNSNVLAVGGAASPSADPELDWFAGGWIGGRIDALKLLIKLSNDQTKIVPSIGPVISRVELQTELDLMQKIYERMVELVRKGYRTQDLVQAKVADGLGRHWNDSSKFIYDAHKGIWAHHNTLSYDVV
jgi:glyoxylase-like metal-dependent hydrolase (beta-lactamase superfamily II)